MNFGTKFINLLVGTRPFKNLHSTTTAVVVTKRRKCVNQGRRAASTLSLTVTRNVSYANHHKRNVLDIYDPINTRETVNEETKGKDSNNRKSVAIYVHGGLWMRGSKDQSFLSRWDIISNIYGEFQNSSAKSESDRSSEVNSSPNENGLSKYSNVGLTLASAGIKTYVVNYRLLEGSGPAHPHQVLDVARAIAFVMQKEQKESNGHCPRLSIIGYSAGAHLTSLALTDLKYLNLALMERGLQSRHAHQMIRAYIALSGVFNLKRLSHSFLKDITIVPAFLGRRLGSSDKSGGDDAEIANKNDEQILLESSPLHLLLSANKRIRNVSEKEDLNEFPTSDSVGIPLIAQIPILLLNAESDFHLHSDSKDLMVALQQFDSLQEGVPNRHHEVMPNRHHLSIMWDFGVGFWNAKEWSEVHNMNDEYSDNVKILQQNEGSAEVNNIGSWLSSTAGQMASSVTSYIVGANEKDNVASAVLTFVKKASYQDDSDKI